MRYSPTLLNPPSTWLSSLKASQLQKIAQATGIRSAGPKAALINRLETELAQCEYPSPSLVSKNKTKTNPKNQNLSILSIDMGIRNLAFAHLLVPSPQSTTRGTASMTTPTLNAWRRLAVSDLLLPSGPEPSSPSPSLPELGSIKGTDSSDIDELSEFACQKDKDGKEMFHPSPYAKQAYILITTLLEKYQPTHVLIERQRFRSGGGSAVQEWTLRVGVFEGMLYAVLYALRRERARGKRGGTSSCGSAPVVLGVEPQRVVRYWGDRLGGEEVEKKKKEEEEEEGRRRRSSSSSSSSSNTREGKKVKMDLVGGWLDDALADGERGLKVAVSGDEELQGWVEAYLAKWKGKKRRRGAVGVADIGKLDDLADCLLQGVTWLDWHIMRDRLLREGVGALEN
ncbi:mitochondrial resolvase Ydc2 [Aspergillus pseudotamarii]|uniref:Mitochondrial resolvase Ydc2 n=1 Tax=Aspergillus pseudotamarii TaxID=132259 RepID=A0A5N6SQ76_ASPPS|nr:mitochondrial resolvase Ydc2 [Aspergillus pseudotamarii]KAE8136846.1 mitochondrial resolvase Ydc2 [Aspergillus pseudotamarii]